MIGLRKKRVLIVDDSALMRKLLTQVLSQSDFLEVVGTARDPYVAWEKIQELNPDVLTLDVEMPRMDGLEFLRKLMIARPTPVVMISSLTESNCETTLRALELGAIDFVAKPKLDLQSGTLKLADEILEKVHVASCVEPRKTARTRSSNACTSSATPGLLQSTHKLIAIGASTGGTTAIHDILSKLPADAPGIVIVQHMPAGFTDRFASRLNSNSRMQVKEAVEGDRIIQGTALVAPGGRHMEVVRKGASFEVNLHDADPVNRFRPSVDVLFESVASQAGKHAIGVILTGMGDDGAAGIKSMRDVGAKTIAQSEASCVVFGMPKAAIAIGGVEAVGDIDAICQMLDQRDREHRVQRSVLANKSE